MSIFTYVHKKFIFICIQYHISKILVGKKKKSEIDVLYDITKFVPFNDESIFIVVLGILTTSLPDSIRSFNFNLMLPGKMWTDTPYAGSHLATTWSAIFALFVNSSFNYIFLFFANFFPSFFFEFLFWFDLNLKKNY